MGGAFYFNRRVKNGGVIIADSLTGRAEFALANPVEATNSPC